MHLSKVNTTVSDFSNRYRHCFVKVLFVLKKSLQASRLVVGRVASTHEKGCSLVLSVIEETSKCMFILCRNMLKAHLLTVHRKRAPSLFQCGY